MTRPLLLTLATFLTCSAALAQDPTAPPTSVHKVTDTYHGVTVTDPYRWLENGQDPAVRAWTAAQDARTRAYLDHLPVRAALQSRLTQLYHGLSPQYAALYPAGGKLFALVSPPGKQHSVLMAMGMNADPTHARPVVDPNALDPSGATEIDWYVPSPDGTRVAVSLSQNGSEDGTLHVFQVAGGKDVERPIPGVQYPTGGGSLAWRHDGGGFWYTRYPRTGPDADRHFYQQVYFHTLGTDAATDTLVLGTGLPKLAEIFLDARQNPNAVVATVANGDGGEYEHFLIDTSGTPRQFTHFSDDIVGVVLGPDNLLYLTSHKDAPRGKLLTLPASDPVLAHATLLVPQSDGVIRPASEEGDLQVAVTTNFIYVSELVGGPSRIAVYNHAGRRLPNLAIPPVSGVQQIVPMPDGSLLAQVATYLRPSFVLRFAGPTAQPAETKLAARQTIDFTDTQVVRAFATSKDGTRIPITIIEPKGFRMDGKAPGMIYGYGGYGLSMEPRALGPGLRTWLDGGAFYAIANIRGGGEYGSLWHEQGALTHKQNVFDDFYAAADYLVTAHYTTHARLGLMGESNGGLLMGAEITQHPSLARAVVSGVGIYDMLRVELDPNGAFNTTEFGSVKDPAQFKALYAYSPYHHVVPGTKYPAVFMATGENDGRVNPAHSRKMIAALQAATASGLPIYLSSNAHMGHGIGSALDVRIGQMADAQAFLFDQLGMTLK